MKARIARPFLLVGVLIGMVLGGYVLAWWSLAEIVRSHGLNWQKMEALAGRRWICDDIRLGGFPFGMVAECSAPRLRQETEAGIVLVSAVRFVAQAGLLSPMTLATQLQGPVWVQLSDSDTLLGNWKDLSGTLVWRPGQIHELKMTLNELKLREASGALAVWNDASADRLHAQLKLKTAGDAQSDWLIDADLKSARLTVLDQITGNADMLDAALVAEFTNAPSAPLPTLPSFLEEWRRSQGEIRIAAASLTKGSFRLEGSGTLNLDSDRRASGTVSGRVQASSPSSEGQV